jgi:hypothetical protein
MAVGLELAYPPDDGTFAGFIKPCKVFISCPAIAGLMGQPDNIRKKKFSIRVKRLVMKDGEGHY